MQVKQLIQFDCDFNYLSYVNNYTQLINNQNYEY